MKASHLLIVTGSLAALSLSFYVTKFSHIEDVALPSNDTLPSADIAKSSYQANDYGGGIVPTLAALKEEISLLKAEFSTLKKSSIGSSGLQKEFFRLKEEVAALHQKVGNTSAMSEYYNNTEDVADSPGEMVLTEQDIVAATQRQAYEDRKQMEVIDSVFMSENIDYQWSAQTSDLIAQNLENSEQIKTDLESLECRATLCRVEVNHHDASIAEEFELQFPLQVGEALPQINYLYEPQDDGSVSVVMYLARDGYDLPQVIQ